MYTLNGHSAYVKDLLFINNENSLLASASDDGTVRIWNLTTNTNKFILQGHTNQVYILKQVSFDVLASGSFDNTINLWNITSGSLIRTLQGHTNSIFYSLDTMLNNRGQTLLVSGAWDRLLKIWNWTTGECVNNISTDMLINSLAVLESAKQTLNTSKWLFYIYYSTFKITQT